MDERKDEPVKEKSEQGSEENFSWEEWTVIDDGGNSKNRPTSQSVKFDDAASTGTSFADIENTSDAEEARECIHVLLQRDQEQCLDALIDDNHVNDESDGVSVITESDAEDLASNENEGEIVVHENDPRAVAKRNRDTEINNLRMIFIIICSLLGSAILCIAINSGTRRNSNEIELAMKTKCNDFFESVKQSAEENDVREIKSGTQEPVFDEQKLENRTGNEAARSAHVKEYLKRIDPSFNDPDNTLFERLQIFLRIMCFLLKDLRYPEPITQQSECEMHKLLPELIRMRMILKSVVSELDASERSAHEGFLPNVEFQIKSISESLVSDLTRALDKVAAKNHKKIDKVSVKLAERLCVLRNTLPSDSKHRESLEKNNAFIENCEKIATRKFDERLKNDISTSPVSPRREKKNSNKGNDASSFNSDKKSRRNPLKRQNNTRSTEIDQFGNGQNPWDTRKCYNLPILNVEELDNTCAILLAPPKSSWKLKHKSSPVKQQKDIEGEKPTDKYPGKAQLKGDRGAPKVLKTKVVKEFDKRKNRKPKMPSLNVNDNVYTIKKTKGKMVEKARSRSIPLGPQNTNADTKNNRIYPPNPTGSRAKKRSDKEDNQFILLDRNEEKETMQNNGRWQFDRSRIRDQLRKDESTSNWYFDRMGSRKNSRMNCNAENEDPRCGASH